MKRLITIAACVSLLSFTQQKQITLTITEPELQLIYEGLGELPAKKVEVLRGKIVQQYQLQIKDTTKGGRP